MKEVNESDLSLQIQELKNRLEEAEQLIEAIKAGEVDAFAITNQTGAEIYTLQTGDYAYRVLIEEFREGAVNCTKEGLIVYTNTYFCNLLKVPYEKIVGSYIFDFIHEESRAEFKRMFRESLSGG